MTTHLATDPACVEHRSPKNRRARRSFERNRGLACPRCFPASRSSRARTEQITPRLPGGVVLPDEARPPDQVTYIGLGGTWRAVHTEMELGRGVWRTPMYGLRRAIWDAAFGYVSGFRKRDILYFVLTRSLSRRFAAWVIDKGR